MKRITAFLALVIAISAFTTLDVAEKYNGTPLWSTLNGANEVPGPGDGDGTGTVYLTLNQGQGTITYDLMVDNIENVIGAHIHIGNSSVAGPVLFHLDAPTDGHSSGTITDVDPDVIKLIRQNPGNYYVNVHTSAFPGGAVRGQLMK